MCLLNATDLDAASAQQFPIAQGRLLEMDRRAAQAGDFAVYGKQVV